MHKSRHLPDGAPLLTRAGRTTYHEFPNQEAIEQRFGQQDPWVKFVSDPTHGDMLLIGDVEKFSVPDTHEGTMDGYLADVLRDLDFSMYDEQNPLHVYVIY